MTSCSSASASAGNGMPIVEYAIVRDGLYYAYDRHAERDEPFWVQFGSPWMCRWGSLADAQQHADPARDDIVVLLNGVLVEPTDSIRELEHERDIAIDLLTRDGPVCAKCGQSRLCRYGGTHSCKRRELPTSVVTRIEVRNAQHLALSYQKQLSDAGRGLHRQSRRIKELETLCAEIWLRVQELEADLAKTRAECKRLMEEARRLETALCESYDKEILADLRRTLWKRLAKRLLRQRNLARTRATLLNGRVRGADECAKKLESQLAAYDWRPVSEEPERTGEDIAIELGWAGDSNRVTATFWRACSWCEVLAQARWFDRPTHWRPLTPGPEDV